MRALWLYLKRQADLESGRRKLWLPVWFAWGIGIYFLLPQEPSKWLTLGLIEALLALAVVFRFRPQILSVLGLLAWLVGGFAWAQAQSIYQASQMGDIPEQKLYLRGRIQSIDHNQKGKLRLTLEQLQNFDRQNLNGRFRITLRQKHGAYQPGQCVELIAHLLPRAQAQLPGGYQFDRKNFFAGLSGSGYAESRALLTDCPQTAGFGAKVHAAIAGWRQRIVAHIQQILPADEAAVAAAIVAGERSGISPRLTGQYRDSGLAHFLSISGLHMSMLAGLMFFFIRLLLSMYPPLALRVDSKKISALAAMVISAVYLLISGAAVPAQRAFVMTLIVLLGILFNRRAISMYTIAWAAAVVLLIAPDVLISASFQMSFAAVVALIAFYEKAAAKLSRWFTADKSSLLAVCGKGLLAYVIGIVVADLVASLATLPFAIYHFNRVAVYTSLANLLAGPIIGFVIMPFTLLALLLMPLGLDTYPLQAVGAGISLVNDITAWVSSLDGASWQVLSMPWWGLVLVVMGGLWLCLWQRRWRWLGLPLIILGLGSVALSHNPDILINPDASVIALQDNQGKMVILPSRGQSFTRQIWLEKTASAPLPANRRKLLTKVWQGRAQAPRWLDLQCNADSCTYKKRVTIYKSGRVEVDGSSLPVKGSGGIAVYLRAAPQIISVRSDIGQRLWNQ